MSLFRNTLRVKSGLSQIMCSTPFRPLRNQWKASGVA